MGPRAVHPLMLQGGIESPLLRRQQPGPPDPGPLMAPALLPVVAPQQLLAVGRWRVGGVAVRWAAGKWLHGLDLRRPGFARGGRFGELGIEPLLGGQRLLARQQTLGPGPLQAEKAVQRPADLALRLAPVAQDQRQAGAGVPVGDGPVLACSSLVPLPFVSTLAP